MAGNGATVDETILTIGERLRDLRVGKDFSLREAGARADISASFIGMVERGESEIAITRLMRLADVYGVTVGDIIGNPSESPTNYLVPLAEGECMKADAGRVEVTYIPLAYGSWQPFRLVLKPGAKLGALRHATAEIFHCLAGQATLTIEGKAYEARTGDTLYIPKDSTHSWENARGRKSVFFGGIERPMPGGR